MWVSSATCCLLFLTLVVSLQRISRVENHNIRTDAAEIQGRWRLMQHEPDSFSAIRGIELCAEAINVSTSHITEVSHICTHTHTRTRTIPVHIHAHGIPRTHATHDVFRINASMSHITEVYHNTSVTRAAPYNHTTHAHMYFWNTHVHAYDYISK